MRIFIIITLSFLVLGPFTACSGDGQETPPVVKEEPKAEENSPPIINGQSFEVEENAISGTLIGTVAASDVENNPLTFSMSPIEGLVLDAKEGTLSIVKGADFLDYETNTEFEFEVRVSDGKATSKTKIVLIITDVEDGPLTNFEKRVIAGFKFEILGNSTDFPLFKWSTTAKIYYSGAVTPGLKAVTSGSIKAYNELFTDGFKIEIVSDSLSANVQLHSSSIADLKKLWPDFGVIAEENPGLGGIAELVGGRIWIADYAQNIRTMKHEMGHMIGLAHSPGDQCGGRPEQNSIMCGGVGAAGEDLTEIDRKIIQYYYHPEIINNQEGAAVLDKLAELILADRSMD